MTNHWKMARIPKANDRRMKNSSKKTNAKVRSIAAYCMLGLLIIACGDTATPSKEFPVTPTPQPVETPVSPAFTEPIPTPVVTIVSEQEDTLPEAVPANFLPLVDGFGFQNFGGNTADSRLTAADLAVMFGPNGICEDLAEWKKQKRCVGTTTALQFLRQLNRVLENGLCYGMSAMSSRFFANTVDPAAFQDTAMRPLDLTKDATISHQLAYWHAIQFTAEARATSNQFDMAYPSEVIQQLAASLQESNGIQYSLGMYSEHGGHAVTPYKVDETTSSMKVWFYDNNWPGEERWMELDKETEEWTYGFASVNLEDADASPWTGSDVGSLRLVPHYQEESGYACFFCKGDTKQSGGTGSTILLNPDKSGENSGLLIVDELGRRLGLVDGNIVNEIPGASYDVMPAGDTLLSAVMVTIPSGTENYEIQLKDIKPLTREAKYPEYFPKALGNELMPGETKEHKEKDQGQKASILIAEQGGPLVSVDIKEHNPNPTGQLAKDDDKESLAEVDSSNERKNSQEKESSVIIKIQKKDTESIDSGSPHHVVSIEADTPTKVTQTLNQSVLVMANQASEKIVSVFSDKKLEELEVTNEKTQETIVKLSDVKDVLSTPVDKFGDTDDVVIKRGQNKVVDIVFADKSAAVIDETAQSINAVLTDGTLVNSQLTDTGDRVASYSDGTKQVIETDGTKVFEDKTGIIVVEKTTGETELFKPTEEKDRYQSMKIEDPERLDLKVIDESDFDIKEDLQKDVSSTLDRIIKVENLFDNEKEHDREGFSTEDKQLLEALDKLHTIEISTDFILHTVEETEAQTDIKGLITEAIAFTEERHVLLENIGKVLSTDSAISEAEIITMLRDGEGMTEEEAWRLLDEEEVVESFHAQEISLAFDRMKATGLTEDEVIEAMKAQQIFDSEEIKEVILEEQLSLSIEDARSTGLTEEQAIQLISQAGEFTEDAIRNVLYEDKLGVAFYQLKNSGLTDKEAIEAMSKDSEINEEQLKGVLRKEELGFDVYHLLNSGFSTEESLELISSEQFDEEEARAQLREEELALEVSGLVTNGSSKKDVLKTILDQGQFTEEEIIEVIREEELHTEMATMETLGLTEEEIWRVMKEENSQDDPVLMLDKMLSEGTSHAEAWTQIREEAITEDMNKMRSSGMSEEQVQLWRMISESELMDELDSFKTNNLTDDDLTLMITKQEIRSDIETMQLAGLDQKEIAEMIDKEDLDIETLEELLDETWIENDVDQLRNEGVSDDELQKLLHQSQLLDNIEKLPETLRENDLLQLFGKETFNSKGMGDSGEQEALLTKMKNMQLEEIKEIDTSLVEAYQDHSKREDSKTNLYDKSYDIYAAKVALLEQRYMSAEIDNAEELEDKIDDAYDEYLDMVSEVEQSYEDPRESNITSLKNFVEGLKQDTEQISAVADALRSSEEAKKEMSELKEQIDSDFAELDTWLENLEGTTSSLTEEVNRELPENHSTLDPRLSSDDPKKDQPLSRDTQKPDVIDSEKRDAMDKRDPVIPPSTNDPDKARSDPARDDTDKRDPVTQETEPESSSRNSPSVTRNMPS